MLNKNFIDLNLIDLESVIRWAMRNNMELHEKKFEVINYTLNTSQFLHHLPFMAENLAYFTSNNTTIEPSFSVRDLGVRVSNDLSWSSHIANIVRDSNVMASWVLSVFADRSIPIMLTLLKSMVRPTTEYCCPVWSPTKITEIRSIENVQQEFTRRISGFKKFDYWQRLTKLRILSLQRRRERYMIIHVWKMYQSIAPNNIGMVFYQTDRLSVRVRLPSLNHKAQRSAATAYDNSFGVKAGKLWNTQPKHVNSQPSLERFKSALGSYLESFPDQPPILGYPYLHRNSLLDWCSNGDNVNRRTCTSSST